jgi:Transcriptional regulator
MPDYSARRARISLRQVEAFRNIVQTGSVSRAAERMFVSQPAVSRLLADMEETVGFALFDRGRRFQLTAEGKLLYREVQQAFVGLDWIARRAEDIAAFRVGHLRVAAAPALSMGLLPPIIGRFHRQYETVSVAAQVRSSQEVAQWAATGQIDIGFAALPINQSGVEVTSFRALPAICMVPRSHRLAGEPYVTPEMLAADQVISLGSDSILRTLIDEAFERAGTAPTSFVETTMSAQAALLVHEGLGIAIIDPYTAMAFEHPGLVLKPLQPFVAYDYVMLTPAHQDPPRLAQAFIAITLQRIEQVERLIDAIYRAMPSPGEPA